jgi:enoyl-CoA hydratase
MRATWAFRTKGGFAPSSGPPLLEEPAVTDPVVLIDKPAPHVRRVTLNRPEKRNALNHALRGGILDALVEGDGDSDVHVQIVCGAGSCFSAGYELGGGTGPATSPRAG